jgi:hypothetical protein
MTTSTMLRNLLAVRFMLVWPTPQLLLLLYRISKGLFWLRGIPLPNLLDSFIIFVSAPCISAFLMIGIYFIAKLLCSISFMSCLSIKV